MEAPLQLRGRKLNCALLCIVLLAPPMVMAETPRPLSVEEHFIQLAATPGWQSEASDIAKGNPERFLALLENKKESVPAILAEVVASDLELARGRREAARRLIRAAAARVAVDARQSFSDGVIPRDGYLTHTDFRNPNNRYGRIRFFPLPRDPKPLSGFSSGGLSDNSLLTRLVALGCDAEAEAEYARVLELHRRSLTTFVANIEPLKTWWGERDDLPGRLGRWSAYRVSTHGFNRDQLVFAKDYASFLFERKRYTPMVALLTEVLGSIDLDREAGAQDWQLVEPGEYHPTEVRDWPGNYSAAATINAPEFIEFAFGIARRAKVEQKLQARLDEMVSAGRLNLLRVFAERARRDHDKVGANTLEHRYVNESHFPQPWADFRRGLVEQSFENHDVANGFFDVAASRPFESGPFVDRSAFIPPFGPHQGNTPYLNSIRILPTDADGERRAFLVALYTARMRTCQSLADKACQLEILQGRIQIAPQEEGVHASEILELRAQASTIGPEVASKIDGWLDRESRNNPSARTRAAILFAVGKQREALDIARDQLFRCRAEPLMHQKCNLEYKQWRSLVKGDLAHLAQLAAPGQNGEMLSCQAHWDVIVAQKKESSCEATSAMETLLRACPKNLREGGISALAVKNKYEFAARLLALHAKCGHQSEVNRLALVLASGAQPFNEWLREREPTKLPGIKWESVHEALRRSVELSDTETRRTIREMWRWREPFPEKETLELNEVASRAED